MLTGHTRTCDVCGDTISKGEKYAVNIVSKEKAELFRSMMGNDPESVPSTTVDTKGNIRLEMCLECRITMNVHGDMEHIN
jgi:hypothetical protein